MNGLRQNIQRKLARAPDERGETPIAGDLGAEPAWRRQSPKARLLEAQPDRTAEVRDPYARWCGRGGAARRPPIPIFGTKELCRASAAVRQRSQNGLWMTQTGMARKLRHDERYQSSAGQRAPSHGVHWLEQHIMLRHGRAAWACTEYNGHMTHYRRRRARR